MQHTERKATFDDLKKALPVMDRRSATKVPDDKTLAEVKKIAGFGVNVNTAFAIANYLNQETESLMIQSMSQVMDILSIQKYLFEDLGITDKQVQDARDRVQKDKDKLSKVLEKAAKKAPEKPQHGNEEKKPSKNHKDNSKKQDKVVPMSKHSK